MVVGTPKYKDVWFGGFDKLSVLAYIEKLLVERESEKREIEATKEILAETLINATAEAKKTTERAA